MDALSLRKKLNALMSDELIAAMQYLIAMNSAVGSSQKMMRVECEEHYKDEVEHFNWICNKMMDIKVLFTIFLIYMIPVSGIRIRDHIILKTLLQSL